MTQEEILEYNKRCAEFLGYEISENKECFKLLNKNGWISLNIFHSDWNWIMEVVEAIEAIEKLNKTVIIDGSKCTITPIETSYIYYKKENKKEAVVQAINQFLIWYNENKTN